MSDYESDEMTLIQDVVDRVSAYQDGATVDTVTDELKKGFEESGVEVATEDAATLASAIYDGDGDVSAEDVLGRADHGELPRS